MTMLFEKTAGIIAPHAIAAPSEMGRRDRLRKSGMPARLRGAAVKPSGKECRILPRSGVRLVATPLHNLQIIKEPSQ